MVVFKCPYGKHVRLLNINRECNRLLSTLRVHLGTAFLQDVRTIVAHPTKVNLFVKTFRYNFLPDWLKKSGVGRDLGFFKTYHTASIALRVSLLLLSQPMTRLLAQSRFSGTKLLCRTWIMYKFGDMALLYYEQPSNWPRLEISPGWWAKP